MQFSFGIAFIFELCFILLANTGTHSMTTQMLAHRFKTFRKSKNSNLLIRNRSFLLSVLLTVFICSMHQQQQLTQNHSLIQIAERPDVPSHLECREVSSRSVKLSWRRPFDGNSPVLSYVVQYKPIKFLHSHSAILSAEHEWNTPNTINITLPNISSTGKR